MATGIYPASGGGGSLPASIATAVGAVNTLDLSNVDGETAGGFRFVGQLLLNANGTGHARVPILLPCGLNPANQASVGDGVLAAMASLAVGLDPSGSTATIVNFTAEMARSKTGKVRPWWSIAYCNGVAIRTSGQWNDTTTAIVSPWRLWLIDGSTLGQQGGGCFLDGSYITQQALGGPA